MAERWDSEGESRLAWTIDGNEPSGRALASSTVGSQIDRLQAAGGSPDADAATQPLLAAAMDYNSEGARLTGGSSVGASSRRASVDADLDNAMEALSHQADLEVEQPVEWAASAADDPFESHMGGDAVVAGEGNSGDQRPEAAMGSTGGDELSEKLSTISSGRRVSGRPRRLTFDRPPKALRSASSGPNPHPNGENPQSSPAESRRSTASGDQVRGTCTETALTPTSSSSQNGSPSQKVSAEQLGLPRRRSLRERMTGAPSPAAQPRATPAVRPIVIMPPRPGSRRLPPVGYSAPGTLKQGTVRDSATDSNAVAAAATTEEVTSEESECLANPEEPLDAHLAFHHSDYGAAAALPAEPEQRAVPLEGGPDAGGTLSLGGSAPMDAQRATAKRATAENVSLPGTPPQHVRPLMAHISPDTAPPPSRRLTHTEIVPAEVQPESSLTVLHRQSNATVPRNRWV